MLENRDLNGRLGSVLSATNGVADDDSCPKTNDDDNTVSGFTGDDVPLFGLVSAFVVEETVVVGVGVEEEDNVLVAMAVGLSGGGGGGFLTTEGSMQLAMA